MAVATKRAASAHLATLVKYVAAAYLVREHIAEFTICVGPSMMPTFDPSGEVALVERMFLATTLRNRPIQKGDIVRIDVSPITRPLGHSATRSLTHSCALTGSLARSFRQVIAKSVQNAKQSVCKRVVGLEGDVVTYRDVTRLRYDVDGYGRYDPDGKGRVRQVTVPKGHVFIQGDNELNSTDSRQYGPVPYATLQGRVVAKVWPKMGWVT